MLALHAYAENGKPSEGIPGSQCSSEAVLAILSQQNVCGNVHAATLVQRIKTSRRIQSLCCFMTSLPAGLSNDDDIYKLCIYHMYLSYV